MTALAVRLPPGDESPLGGRDAARDLDGPAADAAQILAVVCTVMEVSEADMPGKSTPRTKPRLQWARNMAAYVMHDFGISDGAAATAFGRIHRITILVRRRRMAEKLETTQRYRDHHAEILARLGAARRQAAHQEERPPPAP